MNAWANYGSMGKKSNTQRAGTAARNKRHGQAVKSSQTGYAADIRRYAASVPPDADGNRVTPNGLLMHGASNRAMLDVGWSPTLGRNLKMDPTQTDNSQPTGAPRGFGGGGGGGGGGDDGKAQAALIASALQSLLQSKEFTAPSIDGEMARVDQAVSADRASSQGAHDALGAHIRGMSNTNRDLQLTQTPGVDPSLLALLGANGGDTMGYQAQVQLANTLGQQGDANAQRLNQQLTAAQDASQQSRMLGTEQSRTFADSQLGATKLAMEAALQARQRQDQMGLDQSRIPIILELVKALAESGQSLDISQFVGGK
jgi:hypothetical protein